MGAFDELDVTRWLNWIQNLAYSATMTPSEKLSAIKNALIEIGDEITSMKVYSK